MKQILLTQGISDLRKLKLDPWQKVVLNHKGNMALRCSRQSGKSTAVALKARKLAYDFPNTTILIMSASLRQSSLLYEKVRSILELDNIDVIKSKLGNQTLSHSFAFCARYVNVFVMFISKAIIIISKC